MPEEPPDQAVDEAILVPVGESVTLRNTVAYAVREALAASGEIHFVAPLASSAIGDVSADGKAELEELLERATVWAEEDAGDEAADLRIETAVVGADEYLFGPDDYARVLTDYARSHGVERVVVDPEYSPGGNVPLLRPLQVALVEAGLTVEEAPVDRPTRRGQLLRRGGLLQFATLFGVSFLFYQLLSGFTLSGFDLVTGVVSATVVAALLHRIAFSDRMRLGVIAKRLVRLAIFVPYLVYEIVVSNLLVAYVVLHPKMPIEPRTVEVRSAVWGGMPVTTLANSITLTPGTLTVRVRGQDFMVHSLIPAAREGLFDGSLERAVRFVFYGRDAAGISTPRERDDCRILDTVTENGGEED
ncbi:monovalent cation/H+ antiporter subunit E [Natronomonas sp. CBA1123]|uniref:monovalent cation/H+ antiporter subunit E n=1 Tax=Natronomonas sp. CBA1123 TaxID=2668070 RepID=UPI00351B898F